MEKMVLLIITFKNRWAWKLIFYSGSSYCIHGKAYRIWQSPKHLETLEMWYSAAPCFAHHRIAFHYLHLNIFITIECLLHFQILLGNAVHFYNSYQNRMLVRTLLVTQFYTFVILLQCICDTTKWKKHFMAHVLGWHFHTCIPIHVLW